MQSTIIGWNPLLDGTNHIRPSVYIQPTLELLQFFQRSVLHRGVVEIEGSGSCYDGVNLFATIDKSSNVPNCRQNFYNGTGLYVITLEAMWNGYPPQAGVIKFKDGIVNELIRYASPSAPSSPSATSLPSPLASALPSGTPSSSAPARTPPSTFLEKKANVERYESNDRTTSTDDSTALLSRSLWVIAFFFLILLGWAVYSARQRSRR